LLAVIVNKDIYLEASSRRGERQGTGKEGKGRAGWEKNTTNVFAL